MLRRKLHPFPQVLLALLLASALQAQTRVTTPEQQFGHQIGADYVLPNYQQLVAYWQKLAAESDRMTLVDIGKTAEGRTQYMAIVTSPENHRNLARYKEISQRLAKAEGLSEEQARQLAREGKAVIWIDGGLHATEVLGAQQLMETVYQLVSRDDPETTRILSDVIVLAVHANPDGMDLVSDWYMRERDPQKRSYSNIPRLYQKYIGHDNNRDFYASTQAESENLNRQLYHEWLPQIMYNHHQTGPTGTVMFAPPFREPHNYVYDPLIITGLDLVGAAMHNRFVAEEKPGVTMRRGANYSTWWNGGLRTTVYFHNIIGLLTETIGSPTPMEIPFIPNRQISTADLPYPITPQRWHFRQSVDYSVTANYAVLDVASRYKDSFLFNIYKMGRNSIERGSQDSWTIYPRRIERVQEAMREARRSATADGVMAVGGFVTNAPNAEESQRYHQMLRTPEMRDPRGYILSADQTDFPTATKFVNALRETGVTVHRATAAFSVNGKSYPAGSYVVTTAQAFRPHVLDMFEPQDHPNDFRYEGGPPIPPYDAAGWTLAYQMGVHFDRILDGFEGPFEEVRDWNLQPPAGTVAAENATGYLLSPRYNDAFRAVSRLLASREEVHRLNGAWEQGGKRYEAGTFYIPAKGTTRQKLEQLATELGVSFDAATSRPAGEMVRLRQPRIALWDRYGGSMPSGWTRWIMEQYEIPFDVIYPGQLDAGNLRRRYDVIVFVDGAIPRAGDSDDPRSEFLNRMPDPATIPADFRARLGRVTAERTVPKLREFLQAGGRIVTIGSSTSLATHLGLPIGSKLEGADGKLLPREEYYIPGSVLQARVDNTQPVAFGMDERVDVFFDNSPVFTLGPGAESQGIRRVAWYDSAEPLRSGWAWGQNHLEGGAAVVQAPVGRGTLYLFGPEVLYRAQPHGTFKFFFNALYPAAGE
ncbi:MAG: peptidase [Gemmatimonadetes bacterium]|nr:peptidase [Gemmatimonadota bacterium]